MYSGLDADSPRVGIGYLVVANLVERLKKTDEDDASPNVDESIRAVCMMTVSHIEREEV